MYRKKLSIFRQSLGLLDKVGGLLYLLLPYVSQARAPTSLWLGREGGGGCSVGPTLTGGKQQKGAELTLWNSSCDETQVPFPQHASILAQVNHYGKKPGAQPLS